MVFPHPGVCKLLGYTYLGYQLIAKQGTCSWNPKASCGHQGIHQSLGISLPLQLQGEEFWHQVKEIDCEGLLGCLKSKR